MDSWCPGVSDQAEAAAGLVPDDELFDFPFEEALDDDEPSPELELEFDFSAGLDVLDDESPESPESPEPAEGADFDGSDFVDDSESDDESFPATFRLSLR